MKALQYTPVMGEANRPDVDATPIRELPWTSATYALRRHNKGGLTAARLAIRSQHSHGPADAGSSPSCAAAAIPATRRGS